MSFEHYPLIGLSEVMDIQGGAQPPASTFKDQPLPGYVRFVQIRDFETDAHLTFIEQLPKWRYCSKEDVLIARYGASVGRICRGVAGAYNVALAKVIPTEHVSRDFLYHLLRSEYFQGPLSAMSARSAQAGFNKSDLAAIRVPLPTPRDQQAITRTLDALDYRITLLRETNATLEAIAQALFKSWFVDFDPVRAKAEARQPEGMDAATAALFPDSFEESELGLVPKGWAIAKFGDFINRLSVGQKYDQKSACPEGSVPVLDQGKSGVIGYHNDAPGVRASLEDPVVVFANHTCYMRLITFDFSAIQNVLPFNGRGVDTVWAFYATKDRVKFSEYKGHWPDFAIEKSVLPPAALTYVFRDAVDPVIRKIRFNELQAQTLTQLRDTLLPRLISGQLCLPIALAEVEERCCN